MSIGSINVEATKEKGENLADRLPDPVGYNLLAIKPKIVDKTESGVVVADAFVKREESGAVVAMVLKMGDLAYKDTEKFPTGPWCKVGDFIVLRAYAGSRFSVDGEEFIILHDDVVEGTVADPRGIGRAY